MSVMSFFKQETKLDDTGAGTTASLPLDQFANPVAIGDVVVGWMGWDLSGAPALNSVTDNLGNTYTIESGVNDANNNQAHKLFRGRITFPGLCSVTGTLSLAASSRCAQAAIYSGCIDSTPDAQAVQWQATTGTGTDAVSSGASASPTSVPFDLVWAGSQNTGIDTGVISAGTGFTARNTLGLISKGKQEDKVAGVAQAETGTFTNTIATSRCTGLMAFRSAPPVTDYTLFPIQKIADAYTSNSTRTLQ